METATLYPFLFEPNLHPVVWGGNLLTHWKGLPDTGKPIGESWEVSTVPGSISTITNGVHCGRDLSAVIGEMPEQILGHKVAQDNDNQLPLLVKFIDAHRDLSIQVHPNDDMAMAHHQKRGKSEMWYVIDAKPGAFLYVGFSQSLCKDGAPVTSENKEEALGEYRRRVADGSIVELLAKHEVKAGDAFYIPAGRVHAICSGILLAEVQQSSDVTYRIFDYNRPGTDGRLRALHTDLAAEALDYHVEENYRAIYNYKENCANLIVRSPYFSVRVSDITGPFHRNLLKYDSFIITMCLHGDCRIRLRTDGSEVALREGYSTLIPAAIADFDVIPDNPEGQTQILDAFIDNKPEDISSILSRFLHLHRT